MFSRLIPYLASLIVMSAFAASYIYAVNYGKQKAETKCQAEKSQVVQEQAQEDRSTIKQREKADETVRNQDRDALIHSLGDVWVCGNHCEI